MKKILVTTDLSENSERAFPIVEKLAKQFDSEVTVLAVVEDPAQIALVTVMDQPLVYGPDIQKEIIGNIKKDLDKLSDKYLEGIKHECVVTEGDSAQKRILEYAEEKAVDLIVMATQGKTGVKHWILGSVTEKVSRQASCPVLLVPPRKS
ncbi:MAG: universal stress protein [Bdellovibrionota bacterium]